MRPLRGGGGDLETPWIRTGGHRGRWLAALPHQLDGHRRLLTRLLELCQPRTAGGVPVRRSSADDLDRHRGVGWLLRAA